MAEYERYFCRSERGVSEMLVSFAEPNALRTGGYACVHSPGAKLLIGRKSYAAQYLQYIARD